VKPRLLLVLVLFGALLGLWIATCGGEESALPAGVHGPARPPSNPAPATPHGAEPAQLDLAALEAASSSLPREEAVLADPSETIHGRVVTLGGSPAAGAEVRLWTLIENWSNSADLIGSESRSAVSTITDEQGKFLFKNLHLTRYGLTAEKGGRRQHHYSASPGQFLEIRLGDSGTVRGRIECELHGAERFSGVAAIHGGWFTSGYGAVPIQANGTFEIDFVPVGTSALQILVDHHSQLSSASVEIRRPGETVDLLIQLEPNCTVRGKVVDVVTRAPIAGALVRGDSRYDGAGTRTAADGSFTLTDVSMARAITFLEPPEPAMHTIDAEAPGYLDGSIELLLAADEGKPQEHTCTLALYAGIPLSGRILNARGRPLEGLYVTLTQGPLYLEFGGARKPPDYSMKGRTDAEGRFTLAWGANRPTLLRIYSTRHGEWSRNLGHISGARDLGDLQLPDPGFIPVLVMDDAGSPIPEADVSLDAKGNKDGLGLAEASSPNSGWFQSDNQSESTDAAGRCTLLRPPAFPAEIHVSIPDGVQQWEFPLASRSADTQEDLRLTLKGLRTLTGRAQHSDKSAVKGSLTIRDSDAQSRHWSTRLEPDGSFRARASFPDRLVALVSVSESERVGTVQFTGFEYSSKPLEFSLPEFLPVQGRVVDGLGHPVAAATVIVNMHGESSSWYETGADGRFRLLLPPEGAAELAATVGHPLLRGFGEGAGKRVTVTAGQTDVVLVTPEPKKR